MPGESHFCPAAAENKAQERLPPPSFPLTLLLLSAMLVEMQATMGGGGGLLLLPFYKGSPSGQELIPFCAGDLREIIRFLYYVPQPEGSISGGRVSKRFHLRLEPMLPVHRVVSSSWQLAMPEELEGELMAREYMLLVG